jgi:hypothetical protein
MTQKKYEMLNRKMPVFEKAFEKTKKALSDMLLNNHVKVAYLEL